MIKTCATMEHFPIKTYNEKQVSIKLLCGVIITFSFPHKAFIEDNGSSINTSKTAPSRFSSNAFNKACSSTTAPHAIFTKTLPYFILLKRLSFIISLVSFVNGRASTTTSDINNTSSILENEYIFW